MDERARFALSANNPHNEYITLGRDEICRREIESAVKLYILHDEPISAYLLASAANEIMTALSEGQEDVGLNKLRAFVRDHNIPDELSREIFESLSHPYNFLKHGSSNREITNDFPLEHIVMMIYTAVHSFHKMFGYQTTEMQIFYGLNIAWRPIWWAESANQESRAALAAKFGIAGQPRSEMVRVGRLMMAQARAR